MIIHQQRPKRSIRVPFLVFLIYLICLASACNEDATETIQGTNADTSANTTGDGNTQVPSFTPPAIPNWTVLEDLNPDPKIVEVNLTAQFAQVEIGPGLTLNMMTYNGAVPGPLLQVAVGDRVIVHFKNELNEPTTVHWHGLRISSEMDGNPRIQDPIEAGGTFTYDFVVPDAGTFWYHPHLRANEQVEKGLYGPLVVHDPADPVVDQERIIVLDDVLLDGDDFAPFLSSHPEVMHGRTGNALLINGQMETPVVVSTTKQVERWRLINTSNARTFSLSFPRGTLHKVISTDGGLIEEPYKAQRIEIAVGQRYDLEITHISGSDMELTAHIYTLDAQDNVIESPFPLYRVEADSLNPSQATGLSWGSPPIALPTADREVEIVLDSSEDSLGNITWTINGEAHHHGAPLFTFAEGEVVDIAIKNNVGPEHPFHLHGQFFTILDNSEGAPAPGWRDTVLVPGLSTVKIRALMSNPGRWMAHCHILEHSELGMMSEIDVTLKP